MIRRTTFTYQDKHEFQYLDGEPSNSLSLVVPGAGYHTDLPLFYFISQFLAVSKGPVLQARYSSVPIQAIEEVFEEYRKKGKFEDFTIVCKSIGTVRIGKILNEISHLKNSRIIWLTPLLKSPVLFKQMQNLDNPSLIIIGDKDGQYEPKLLDQLTLKPNYEVYIAPDATHSLEYQNKGEVQASLKILSGIMEKVEDFILKC